MENMRIKEELHNMNRADKKLLEPLKESFSFLNRAKFEFENGNYEKKRMILKLISSNPTLKAKTPLITAEFPFDVLPKNGGIPNWLDHWEQIRGFAKEIKRYSALFDKIV